MSKLQKSRGEQENSFDKTYHFDTISSILTIITVVATFLSLFITFIYYILFNILISIYGISDKSLFCFNLYQFLILFICMLVIVAVYNVLSKIHHNTAVSKVSKFIVYVIIFLLIDIFLVIMPYDLYNQMSLISEFIVNLFILLISLVVIYYLEKNMLLFIKDEVIEIKQSKSILKEVAIRLGILFVVATPIFLAFAYVIIRSQKQYLFTENNELIVYSSNEKYVIISGEYNEMQNLYIYDYGKYKIIPKDNETVLLHYFKKIEKRG